MGFKCSLYNNIIVLFTSIVYTSSRGVAQMKKYFAEYSEMDAFIRNNNVEMVSYKFTFAYGYELIYKEKEAKK